MARFQLFLLGPPRLERDGVALQFDTRKILALVAYVALAGSGAEAGHVSRESLVALLWPDLEPSRARGVLRRNLSLLLRALDGEWLVVDRQTVHADPAANVWLDVDRFSQLVAAGQSHGHGSEELCAGCLEALAEAVALYRGDFMEGFGLRDSVAYDDWQFFQAESLRQELAWALEGLARGHRARGDYEAALPYARRWLALDSLHEPAHRQLMELYARTGQRAAALRQYQECVRILDEELGLAPDPETTALYEQIRTVPPVDPLRAPVPDLAVDLDLSDGERAPGGARHNLPVQPTPFVGREEELAELQARVQDPACRLLTLLGPGGIGKTRLALRLAEQLVAAAPPSLEHGVFFVSLAPLSSAEGVVPAVAEALGYSFRTDTDGNPRATPRRQLLDHLRRRQLLLVLDNYEHLLSGGTNGDDTGDGLGFVTDVLASAPGVKLVVTSRAGLKVQGEHLYPLAGLRVPDPASLTMDDAWLALPGYSAVALFVQRAQQARPDLNLRPQDWLDVAHLCELLQGMPLAILLAAAWVEVLTPHEITAEIQRNIDFLETDERDVPPRQRSIRAVCDHSWRLLGEHEREMWQGLSVFSRGFSREAAREVVGASLRDLLSLANKSLLHTGPLARYELHELLRQYAAGRLAQVPEQEAAVRDRHCAYYTAALERWAGELKGARQRQAIDEMNLEIENARAAWDWAVAHGQVARLAQAVDGIWRYHSWRQRYEEGECAVSAAARSLEADPSPAAQRLRARLLILWSQFKLWFDSQTSGELLALGQALLEELEQAGHDVRSEKALALLHESRMKYYYETDPLLARQSYERAVVLYEALGDPWGLARALGNLGWITEHLGEYREAQRVCERSLAIRRELGDQRGMADAMLSLGVIAWVQGQLGEADRLLRESLGIFRALDDWNRVAHTTKSLGEVLVRRGSFVAGLGLLESSTDIYDSLEHRYGVSGMLPFLAEAKLHLGQYAEARSDAERGVTTAAEAWHRWGVGFGQLMAGLATQAQGDHQAALGLFQEAAAIFVELRHRENRGWVLGPLALAALRTGDAAQARHSAVEALASGVELGAFMPVLYALPAVALLLADRGADEQAIEVVACAAQYGFLANSRWYQDMAGTPLLAVQARLPADVVQAAQERGRAQTWDTLAARLVIEL